MNASRVEGKFAYVTLNIPTVCPPRTGFQVNTWAWFVRTVSSQHARFAFGKGCDRDNYVRDEHAGKLGRKATLIPIFNA